MLGIVFGVCSVIAMLAIGEGASFEAQEQIKNLGSQNIILRSVKPPEEQKASDKGQPELCAAIRHHLHRHQTHPRHDPRRHGRACPRATSATTSGTSAVAWIARSFGTVPWYPEMRNHRVAEGRFFTDNDMDQRKSVCVLGAEIAPVLFPIESPLGKHVRVGGNYYQVIGIMEPRTVVAAKDPAPRPTSRPCRECISPSKRPGSVTVRC
ncbi:MAG: ABC transporter permease [Verrucomicrobiota bacterium]